MEERARVQVLRKRRDCGHKRFDHGLHINMHFVFQGKEAHEHGLRVRGRTNRGKNKGLASEEGCVRWV
eukprot:1144434-Pelagomonas_calceolata.AAC.5